MAEDRDHIWVLEQAEQADGFMPQTRGGALLAMRLEGDGLLIKSLRAPIWHLTDKGKVKLKCARAS
ncbi:MAG TPA: hypothetical protein VHT52_16220 [Stellaceae bacterium]|jgi:hypothetical protein|nr:hypothetical protein [Stellaceae bacterium]